MTNQTTSVANDASQTTGAPKLPGQVEEKDTLIVHVAVEMLKGMALACIIMVIIFCVCAYMKVRDSDGKIKEGTYLLTENPLWSSVSIAGVVVLFGCYGAYEYYHP